MDTVIETPEEIVNCDLPRGFCCNGFQFNIEPNQTISPNETLQLYRGRQYVGNVTKLRYGCNNIIDRGSNFHKRSQFVFFWYNL